MALSRKQIEALFVKEGGNPAMARGMANIALRESGGRPKINNRGLDKNGTVDWGLFQINDIWRKDPVVGPLFRSGKILTPEGNTRAALHILKVQGPKAWATYDPTTDAKYLGGLRPGKGGGRRRGDAVAATPARFDQAGFDAAGVKASILAGLLSHGNPQTKNPLVRFGLLAPDRAAFTTPGSAGRQLPTQSSARPAPITGAGKFRIVGANPGRLKPPLIAFAKKVAAVYGKPLTGDSGATHSKYTTTGNVSDHWSGHATDIPATGRELLRMGRAALIAAGMPRAQAMKQTGGLYNLNGHQIIFLTSQGGNHYNHLHISAR